MREDIRLATKKAFERPARQSPDVASERRPVAYVSYSHSDSEIVLSVLDRLRLQGIDLWFDREQLRAGDPWRETIARAIASSAAVLFFVGKDQIYSEWREFDLHVADGEAVPVIPVLLYGATLTDLPQQLRTITAAWIDSSSPERFEESVARLARDVAHLLSARREPSAAPIDPDDPQNGLWGQEPARNGRELVAAVRPISDDYFEVTLEVHSTNSKPLDGEVEFHLHPTFAKSVQKVPVADGRAVLKLLCWGAFTVGAVADDGQTTLELDLAANTEFPRKFTER